MYYEKPRAAHIIITEEWNAVVSKEKEEEEVEKSGLRSRNGEVRGW